MTTRVALYARVSHSDDQDPELQLAALRTFAADRGSSRGQDWEVVGEYVDRCSAVDLRSRIAWRELMGRARRREVDVILVWKLDRAFRSTLHALAALRHLEAWGVGFVCTTQPIDTTNALGRYVLTGLAAAAEFERELISERTRAGLERAKARGVKLGRPAGAQDRRKRRKAARREPWPDVDGIPA